ERARINAEIDAQIKENKDFPGAVNTLEQARGIQLRTADQNALLAPIKSVTDAIKDQAAAIDLAAQTYGKTAGELAKHNDQQKILNDYENAVVELTPQIPPQIAGLAEQFGQNVQRLDELTRAQREATQEADDMRAGFKDLAHTIADDIASGNSKNIGKD